MRRSLRIVAFIIAGVVYFLTFNTMSFTYIDYMIAKYLNVTPWWNPVLYDMVRWNRLVKKYGTIVATEKFNRREFE